MKQPVCQCCGQTLPPGLDLGVSVRLTHIQQEIVDAIHKAGKYGIKSDRLLLMIYLDRIDGGPLFAQKALHVQIFHINRKLKHLGRKVINKGAHGGTRGHGTYVLGSINDERQRPGRPIFPRASHAPGAHQEAGESAIS